MYAGFRMTYAVISISVVTVRQARLVLGWVTCLWTGKQSQYVASQPVQLILSPSAGESK